MEGNLRQLLKSRKGRPLAGGLACSIFSQILAGLGHMHSLDFFQRDRVPVNILASTTGLFAYRPVANSHPPRGALIGVGMYESSILPARYAAKQHS